LKHLSAPFAERQNRALRMNVREFTWLTNAFSKGIEMPAASVAAHSMHDNFADVHKTRRISPRQRLALPISFGRLRHCGHDRHRPEINLTHYPKIILLVKAIKSIYLYRVPLA